MFGRLRWLTILAPLALIGLMELLSDSVLDAALPFPADTLLVMAIVAALAIAFSTLAFRQIDALAATLSSRNAELEQRNLAIRALQRVSLAIAGLTDLDRVLAAVVDQARGLLGADAAALVLDGGTGDQIVRASSGDPTTIARLPVGIRSEKQPGPELGSRLEAPLQRGPETLGSLVVVAHGPRTYGADDVETLSTLASQASIAIENARLQERLRDVAVAEERERIAREMHDGLAQVLGYVNTKSQAVEQLLEDNRVADARTHLRQLAEAARSIYVDVREAILGLASSIDPGSGLVPAIEAYASRFAEASKLVVEVRASATAREIHLPPEVQGHVFRIIQEALTNVRKHAAAHRSQIAIDVHEGLLELRVSDDGRGIDATAGPADWPHYGIAAMRGRAAAIGGQIQWLAGPAGGTVVHVEVPLDRASTAPAPAGPVP